MTGTSKIMAKPEGHKQM